MSCECYRITEETRYLTDFEQGIRFATTGKRITKEKVKVAHCWGTKECEECKCGGDRSKCDFYPEVRKEAEKEQEINKALAKARNDRWISVYKRLPKIGQNVLIYTTDNSFAIDSRFTDPKDGYADPFEFTHNNAYYWRPLPEEPQEEENTDERGKRR